MPDYISYFGSHSATLNWGTWGETLTDQEVQQHNEVQKQYLEQQECIAQQMWEYYQQQMEEEKQLEEDKENYPLFYWQELCSKQKKELTSGRP